ncbi:GNAT family N-acetyltransferase [Vibrio alfacsensis]|uniref:GNAT family N-acetyltransferase n=1 Tax=Vibrio alfacsensis TaxID=1074311 RepID=UPI00406924E2
MKGYRISTAFEDMDLDVIHQFISQSYWAKGIPKQTMDTAVRNAFCFGVFTDANQQIAFARLITDRATFVYLADVFVLPEYRSRGISKWLISEIVAHPDLQGLRRMMLATRDAHGLYAQYGFKPIEPVENFMQIWQPDVYQK